MGTSKTGRYLHTQGGKKYPSEYAVVHSNEGTFVNVGSNKQPGERIRLKSGGHGQDGMNLLNKFHIQYNIVKTYSNGVRIGNISNHYYKSKRTGANQSWFPTSWTAKTIEKAGIHVASLKCNKHVANGKPFYGMYKGVKVGVIRTNGVVGTIFPDSQQPTSKRRIK